MSDEFWLRKKATRRRVLERSSRLAACTFAFAGSSILSDCALVQSSLAQSARGKKPSPSREAPPAVITGQGAPGLPPAVADMLAEIQSAVETGNIAELRRAMDLNELKPEFGAPPGADALEFLRTLSPDGTGQSVLADLGRLIEAKWAAIPGGQDIENNRIYVWPHVAQVPLDQLTGEDRAVLEALAGAEAAQQMIASNRFQGWRLTIGADGVWHTFMRIGG